MKFRKVLLIALISIIGSVGAYASDAPVQSPQQIFDAALPEVGARGIIFQENMQAFDTIGYVRYSHIPAFGPSGKIEPADFWNFKLCSSWDDVQCELKQGYTLEGRVYLGHCADRVELGCVESLSIKGADGLLIGLTYVGPAMETVKDISESRRWNIPRSSSPILFKDSKENLYLVRAGIFYSITAPNSVSPKMDVDVYPVLKVSDTSIKAPEAVVVRNSAGLGIVTVNNARGECLAISTAICYKQSSTNLESEFSLAMRLPKSIGGWFKGRLNSPQISVVQFNDSSNSINVTAKSVAMPIMGGWVKFNELPSDFISNLYPSGGYPTGSNQTLGLYADASQGARAFQEFTAWAPFLKDRALTTINIWSFGTNMGSSANRCLSDTSSVAGVVSTNASVYSSEPPTWNAQDMTLDYKIAAPHFDAKGELNVGSYTLAISNSTIKCLYGVGELPASATVSIVYGDSVTSVGTVAVGSKDGWSYFSADGFHFSAPTVRVKFAKPSLGPTSPPNAQGVKTQWCAKGYAKKKVTAVNPVCPKGYKKIKAPFTP